MSYFKEYCGAEEAVEHLYEIHNEKKKEIIFMFLICMKNLNRIIVKFYITLQNNKLMVV